MDEYEYTIGGLPTDVATIQNENNLLNQMGKDGWQLCAVYRDDVEGKKMKIHYFKRVKAKPLIIKPN